MCSTVPNGGLESVVQMFDVIVKAVKRRLAVIESFEDLIGEGLAQPSFPDLNELQQR